MAELIIPHRRLGLLSILVDDADLPLVNQYRWYGYGKRKRNRSVYLMGYLRGKRKQGYVLLHRLLLGLAHGDPREADHIDGNGLNNQRRNLRIVSGQQNIIHGHAYRHGKSGRFKGVYSDTGSARRPFCASIQIQRHQYHLGLFPTAEEAALAYDAAARKAFGEFAHTNFNCPYGCEESVYVP